MPNTHEQKFFNALRDIFVGARIEGESGYINLMRIKSRYYTEGVFPKLMETIDGELKPFPNFREELFDKLYSFFKRYFSESGSIYFRHTPYYQDIYERIYTDDRDVMLFWKTQNLYYVKTDRLFRSMTLNLDDAPDQKFAFDASAVERQSFNFDASGLQNKRNNEKRNLIFEYKGKAEDETLKFAVQYTESGKKTKIDDILKAIKKDGVAVNEDQLTRAFRLFERQSEVDFFINKNAKAFLEEQFDLWMYQYLFKRESDWTEKRIREMQALKRVARSIIEFISQFEDELVRIWNKPKFALSSNYVITFDRVFTKSEAVARKLLAHENMDAQVAEWRELGMIDEGFTLERIFERDEEKSQAKKKKAGAHDSLFDEESSADKEPSTKNTKRAEEEIFSVVREISGQGKLSTKSTKSTKRDSFDSGTDTETTEDADALPELSARYRYLPFDTKHFKSLELEILSLFDNLDEELDGRLVHSENYQALNTLKDKFREKVKCIYIDPPYNTSASEITYENRYKHSSWLSLLEARLSLSEAFLDSEGAMCIAIDDYELTNLSNLIQQIFPNYDLQRVIVNHYPGSGTGRSNISRTHEYSLFVLPTGADLLRGKARQEGIRERNFRRSGTGENNQRTGRPNSFFAVLADPDTFEIKTIEPPPALSEKNYPKDRTEEGWVRIYPFGEDKSERVWSLSYQGAVRALKAGLLACTKNLVVNRRYIDKEARSLVQSVWLSKKFNATTYGTNLLTDIFGNSGLFSYPKSLYTVSTAIDTLIFDDDEALVLDYFAGSGTTAHAVINLNREDGGQRKYILVEANDYFHTVILPRVKKVVFSDKWKDGTARDDGKGASHFCKYFALEQYEDTLRRALYVNDSDTTQPAFFDNPYESPFASYVFLRDKKMSDALAVDYEKNKISVDFSKLYEDIDLAETLSCIKGKFIKSLTADSVTFADGETVKFDELDYRDILPLIWWDK